MKQVKEKLELVVEAGMQMVPVVGGPLATLYFGNKQEKRFKRIENFYNDISQELECAKERIKSIEEHNEEELSAILEDLNEKVEMEHFRIKIELYKTYFKNTMIFPVNNNYDERKMFLDIISQLTPLQIELMSFLAKENGEYGAGSISKQGVEQTIILGAISQLKILGLVSTSLNSIVFGTQGGNAINENIKISDLGIKFHKFCMSSIY